MATFSAVTRQHILQAIAEYDSRGRDDFLGVYGYDPSVGYALQHDGRDYDPAAILGVAHRYATGRLAPAHEFSDGLSGATAILRKRGFDVTEPAAPFRPAPAAPARRTPAPRTAAAARPTTRTSTRAATPERPVAMCPTCSMVLPATGICDYCS
ncbi:hypothetical protein Cch01nite_12940 [Cellulomonas chitinilytica]|uniref:ScoMcrA-like N-terminal head domain-containing protein n=1 Tax=Cellulomonas chitinilytica TaxID=398759 RepID=A0A919TYG5_9CELL|nr:hypothetical protein [Cellulomonas chitinilytica]GIG20570.1 hypothetical protein Cch01nite_12940 [Cellulomonas chitinilytica]